MKKYIKNNILLVHNIFNKNVRQFRIFLLVSNAHCSLRFYHLVIGKVCEGDAVLQRVSTMFKCVRTIHDFCSKFFVLSFY